MTKSGAVKNILSEIISFIGTEIGDPTSEVAEKPPKSARHVVTASWSWSPMHSRVSKYRLAGDRVCNGWHLFETSLDFDSGKSISARVASGYPYQGVNAKAAARTLLKAVWLAEVEQWDFDPSDVDVDKSGLLTQGDVEEIADCIVWQKSSEWLGQQSEDSLAALREEWPGSMDDQAIEVADELQSCAEDLGLSYDFLELCKYYDVKPPNLLALACKLIAEATIFRKQREERAEVNRKKFQEEINTLISDLSTTGSRGGGITIPSQQSMVRNFLELYVGANGELPTGRHQMGVFNISFDFDELRAKYGI